VQVPPDRCCRPVHYADQAVFGGFSTHAARSLYRFSRRGDSDFQGGGCAAGRTTWSSTKSAEVRVQCRPTLWPRDSNLAPHRCRSPQRWRVKWTHRWKT
jgi:hypothetical protein